MLFEDVIRIYVFAPVTSIEC